MELSGACKDTTEVAGCRGQRAVCSGYNAGDDVLGADGELVQSGRGFSNLDLEDPGGEVANADNRMPRWESVWHRVDVGLVVLDLKRGKVVEINESARSVMQARDIEVTFDGLQRMVSGGESVNIEQLIDGRSRQALIGGGVIGFTLYRGDEETVVMLIRDITELCQVEAVAQAADLTETIGYVFAGLRHELGNPVNSLKVAVQVLRRNLDLFSTQQVGAYLDRIIDEVARVEHLLAGLRSFSMYETPQPQVLHLPEFMNSFMVLMRRDLVNRGVRMTTHIDEDAEYVIADRRSLSQVLLNVSTNAIEACGGQAVPLISLHVGADGNYIKMQIDDNRAGVQGSDKALFKPFRTTKQGGTALGLVITRKLLAAMHGTISIGMIEGGGARATIVLPRPSDAQIACCAEGGGGLS